MAAASRLQWKCGLSLGKQTTMIQSVVVTMAVMPSKLRSSMFWLLVWLAAGASALDYYDYEYEDHSHTSFGRIRRKSYRSVVRISKYLIRVTQFTHGHNRLEDRTAVTATPATSLTSPTSRVPAPSPAGGGTSAAPGSTSAAPSARTTVCKCEPCTQCKM